MTPDFRRETASFPTPRLPEVRADSRPGARSRQSSGCGRRHSPNRSGRLRVANQSPQPSSIQWRGAAGSARSLGGQGDAAGLTRRKIATHDARLLESPASVAGPVIERLQIVPECSKNQIYERRSPRPPGLRSGQPIPHAACWSAASASASRAWKRPMSRNIASAKAGCGLAGRDEPSTAGGKPMTVKLQGTSNLTSAMRRTQYSGRLTRAGDVAIEIREQSVGPFPAEPVLGALRGQGPGRAGTSPCELLKGHSPRGTRRDPNRLRHAGLWSLPSIRRDQSHGRAARPPTASATNWVAGTGARR